MSSSSRAREFKQAIQEELGLHDVYYQFVMGSKHPCVVISLPDGTKAKFVYPGTPGDQRGLLNNRADLRRLLWRLGAKRKANGASNVAIGGLGDALVSNLAKSREAADEASEVKVTNIIPASQASAESVLEVARLRRQLKDALKAAKTKSKISTHTTTTPTTTTKPTEAVNKRKEEKMTTHHERHDERHDDFDEDGGNGRRAWQMLTHKEVAKATRLLAANSTVSDDGLFTYGPSWSDERILKILQAEPGRDRLTLKQISRLRRESFGDTKDERVKSAAATGLRGYIEIREKIKSLESRILALEDSKTAP